MRECGKLNTLIPTKINYYDQFVLFPTSKSKRAEGGIEPLGYYTATDLKSAHHTSEAHPRI